MKTLIFGDIHGRTQWYDIIMKEQPDKIIFLGDYVSSHENISPEQQCSNLEDILNFKEENYDDVILLRGNHDLQHLNYYWAYCSGYERKVGEYMLSIKDRFLAYTQWVTIIDDIIFSHAGISKTWFKSLNLGEPTKENILKINDLEPSELFAFTPERYSDYCGDSVTQPCTWIRPTSLLLDCLDDWIQVVGHTRPYKAGNVLGNGYLEDYRESYKFNIPELWCIDAMPSQYMVIENNIREMKTFNNNIEI